MSYSRYNRSLTADDSYFGVLSEKIDIIVKNNAESAVCEFHS